MQRCQMLILSLNMERLNGRLPIKVILTLNTFADWIEGGPPQYPSEARANSWSGQLFKYFLSWKEQHS